MGKELRTKYIIFYSIIISSFILPFAFNNCSPVKFSAVEEKIKDDIRDYASSDDGSCFFIDKKIANGDAVTAWNIGTANAKTSCQSEVRKCTNGILEGTYTFKTCSPYDETKAPPCATGKGLYCDSSGAPAACTNAPPNSQYTGSGVDSDNCPWSCKDTFTLDKNTNTCKSSISSTQPTTCNAQPGFYCESSNATTPKLCELGYYCPGGATTHLICTIGSYCNIAGLSSPIGCTAGYKCTTPGLTALPTTCIEGYEFVNNRCQLRQQQLVCQASPGSYCPPGTTTSQICPLGNYCAGGTAQIELCPIGYYCPNSATKTQCPSGYNCTTTGLISLPPLQECSAAAGSYCPTSSSTSSILCPAGKYCLGGSSQPSICTSGYFCAGGASSPTQNICPAGYYCPSGSTSGYQNPCTGSTYCPAGSSSAYANPCPPNNTCSNGIATPITGPKPTMTLISANQITTNSAVIGGSINPNGLDSSFYFEYGPSTAYGSQTSPISVGSGNTKQDKSQLISSLQAGTTYHYRIVGSNASGLSYSDDGQFTTLPNLDASIELTIANLVRESATSYYYPITTKVSSTGAGLKYIQYSCYKKNDSSTYWHIGASSMETSDGTTRSYSTYFHNNEWKFSLEPGSQYIYRVGIVYGAINSDFLISRVAQSGNYPYDRNNCLGMSLFPGQYSKEVEQIFTYNPY